jgi:hypothetical protein
MRGAYPAIRVIKGISARKSGHVVGMAWRMWSSATAAAVLPAALAGAALVSAPFAGTTTAPLADSSHLPHSARVVTPGTNVINNRVLGAAGQRATRSGGPKLIRFVPELG